MRTERKWTLVGQPSGSSECWKEDRRQGGRGGESPSRDGRVCAVPGGTVVVPIKGLLCEAPHVGAAPAHDALGMMCVNGTGGTGAEPRQGGRHRSPVKIVPGAFQPQPGTAGALEPGSALPSGPQPGARAHFPMMGTALRSESAEFPFL